MESKIVPPIETESLATDAAFEALIKSLIEARTPESRVGQEFTVALAVAKEEQARRSSANEPYLSLKEIFAEYLFNDPHQFETKQLESEALSSLIQEAAISDVKSALLQQAVVDERIAQELSGIDQLTQMANRRKIVSVLESWFSSERAEDKNREFALVLVDIDNFKKINDTYGHNFGDEVLRQISAIIRSCFRTGTDLVGRWGGEEFIILAPIHEADVEAKLLELKAKLQHPLDTDPPLVVTGSIGWSMHKPHEAQHPDELIHEADLAMYDSKHSGKNRITKYDLEKHRAMTVKIVPSVSAG